MPAITTCPERQDPANSLLLGRLLTQTRTVSPGMSRPVQHLRLDPEHPCTLRDTLADSMKAFVRGRGPGSARVRTDRPGDAQQSSQTVR